MQSKYRLVSKMIGGTVAVSLFFTWLGVGLDPLLASCIYCLFWMIGCLFLILLVGAAAGDVFKAIINDFSAQNPWFYQGAPFIVFAVMCIVVAVMVPELHEIAIGCIALVALICGLQLLAAVLLGWVTMCTTDQMIERYQRGTIALAFKRRFSVAGGLSLLLNAAFMGASVWLCGAQASAIKMAFDVLFITLLQAFDGKRDWQETNRFWTFMEFMGLGGGLLAGRLLWTVPTMPAAALASVYVAGNACLSYVMQGRMDGFKSVKIEHSSVLH